MMKDFHDANPGEELETPQPKAKKLSAQDLEDPDFNDGAEDGEITMAAWLSQNRASVLARR